MEEVKKEKSLPVSEDITAVFIDRMLDKLRGVDLKSAINKAFSIITMVSLYGFYLAALLGLIASMVIKFKLGAMAPFFTMLGIGLGVMLSSLVLHYLSVKLLPEIKGFIKSEKKLKFSSKILDCMTVFVCLTAIGALILGISFGNAISGITVFIIFGILSLFLIQYDELNIERTDEPVKASKQFEGILAVYMRGFLAMVPVFLFFGVILLNLLLIVLMFQKNPFAAMGRMPLIVSLLTAPLIGYMTFVLYAFVMDIYTSILAIPEKLDKK